MPTKKKKRSTEAAPPGAGEKRNKAGRKKKCTKKDALAPPSGADSAVASEASTGPRRLKKRPVRGKRKRSEKDAAEPKGLDGSPAPEQPSAASAFESVPPSEAASVAKNVPPPTFAGVAGSGTPAAKAARPLHGCDAPGARALDDWLRKGGATFDALEVRNDAATAGLGVFARRDIAAGEVAFVVPAQLMISSDVVAKDETVSRVAELLQTWGDAAMPELLMCMRLCRARARSEDEFHAYASSLPEAAPGAASWPPAFREVLAATSLGPSLVAADKELDKWEAILKRVSESNPKILEPRSAFTRASLEWARGMLQSRHFPAAFAGATTGDALCMVPLLDLLNHNSAADVRIQVGSGCLRFICDGPVKAGEQIWNNYGSKSNDELLMCYGFAVVDNKSDTVSLALSSSDGSNASVAGPEIRLTLDGVPQDVIDSIEEEQNTEQFVSLLKAVLVRRRIVKDSLSRLPQALNFNVCKGPSNRARKRSIEAFLEGQLNVLEAALEGMKTAQDDGADDDMAEEEAEGDGGMEEGEEEEVCFRRRKKRRRRRR